MNSFVEFAVIIWSCRLIVFVHFVHFCSIDIIHLWLYSHVRRNECVCLFAFKRKKKKNIIINAPILWPAFGISSIIALRYIPIYGFQRNNESLILNQFYWPVVLWQCIASWMGSNALATKNRQLSTANYLSQMHWKVESVHWPIVISKCAEYD